MEEDIVRILRIVEYIGPRSWVENAVKLAINGTKNISGGMQISAATIGSFPEILKKAGESEDA